MEIKKVMVVLKKVHSFLVWEYCYFGDQGKNGAWVLVPRGDNAKGSSAEEPVPFGKSSTFPEVSGAEATAAAGDTEGP